MTREEFNKNSYLVNSNALYNKHTEHISTTEPIFIDGMAGSDNIVHEREGDASQNTYWAYEYESGKFMLGKFNEDDIKVKCETDSSDLWIVDAEGVYIEQDALNNYMESDCLDAINAKYGTNFSTLTMQKVKSIDIGDTVPNWDAYEKIELPKQYVKIDLVRSNYAFGYVQNKTLKVYGPKADSFFLANSGGEILSSSQNAASMISGNFIPRLIAQGYDVESGETQSVVYEIGDHVNNWENYKKITQ